METNYLVDALKTDVRYKNVEKRRKFFWKRFNAGAQKGFALVSRIQSMNEKNIVLPIEIEKLRKKFFKIQIGLLKDCGIFVKLGVLFESEMLNGESSAAIDKYFARQERVAIEQEEAMDQAEAAQARITALLDALG